MMSDGCGVRIVLASGSARRRELLAEAGYRFSVVRPAVDEADFCAEGVEADEYARALALAKARSVAPRYPRCVVIGADTVVDSAGRIIGKAGDAAEAEAMLKELFSVPHRVITGLAIVRRSDGLELVASESTTVYPRKVTDQQIAEHIRGGTWRGKAGAYAIRQGHDPFVERIEGSLTNVMGLPMELLRRMLERSARGGGIE